ncbi:MAG: MFS transporter [Xanthobacteraceae bacterium]|nr:MFS transporter [Xanthobacteraceae bacterium]
MAARIFYGWWIVAACLLIAILSWGLGVFGAGVSLHAITQTRGLSVGSVSTAITMSGILSAIATFFVGPAIDRYGPRPVMAFGALVMAVGLALIGQVQTLPQVYGAFILSGLGNACLSVTAITAAISPWFEKYQGRAMSSAMLGASVGGMSSTPILLLGVEHIGFPATMLWGAGVLLAVVLPLALFVIHKSPAQLGLYPDGEGPSEKHPPTALRGFTRAEAIRTVGFLTLVLAFSLGLGVQVGFLTHHVTLSVPFLGTSGASFIVSITAIAAFAGRVALARWADQVDLRTTAAAVLCVAAVSLEAIAAFPIASVLIGASLVYGLTTGNVTTLSPIIMRREFGAAAFGAINGAAWMLIGIACALGPVLFGWMYDWFGGYGAALHIAGALDLAAAAIVYLGRPKTSFS